MPLVLPLVFFFSDSFYSIAYVFLFWFVLSLSLSLSLSLYWFWSSVFFLLRLCLFACVCFLISCSNGESRGGWYTWRQSWCSCVGWPVLSSLCFCFSFAYSLIFLPWVFFFLSFCSPVFARPPFRLLCVSFTSCVLCVHFVSVPCSCFCSSSVYPRGPFYFLSLCFRSLFVPQ